MVHQAAEEPDGERRNRRPTQAELREVRRIRSFLKRHPQFKHRGRTLWLAQHSDALDEVACLHVQIDGEIERHAEPIDEIYPSHWNVIDSATVFAVHQTAVRTVKKCLQLGLLARLPYRVRRRTATDDGYTSQDSDTSQLTIDSLTATPDAEVPSLATSGERADLARATTNPAQPATIWSDNPLAQTTSQPMTISDIPAPDEANHTSAKETAHQPELLHSSPSSDESSRTAMRDYGTKDGNDLLLAVNASTRTIAAAITDMGHQMKKSLFEVQAAQVQVNNALTRLITATSFPPATRGSSLATPQDLEPSQAEPPIQASSLPSNMTDFTKEAKVPTVPLVTPDFASEAKPQENPATTKSIGDIGTPLANLGIQDARVTNPLDEETRSTVTWKLTDIGLFWPVTDKGKTDGQSIEIDGKDVIFRDIHLWTQTLRQHWKEPGKKVQVERYAWQLLRGSAMSWYQQYLTKEDQQAIIGDFTHFCRLLIEEFGIRPAEAQDKLDSLRYTRQDLLEDRPIQQYAADVFRYSKALNDVDEHRNLLRVYNRLDPELRQFIVEPTSHSSRADFLRCLEHTRRNVSARLRALSTVIPAPAKDGSAMLLEDSSEEQALWTTRRPPQQQARHIRPEPGQKDHQSPWNQGPPERDEDNHAPSQGYQRRFGPSNRNSGRRYQTDRQFRPNRNGPFQRRRWQRWGQQRPNNPRAYFNQTMLYEEDDDFVEQRANLEEDGYLLIEEGEDTTQSAFYAEDRADPQDTAYLALHEDSPTQRKEDVNLAISPGQIINAVGDPAVRSRTQGPAFTHLKVTIQFNVNGERHDVCLDTGASTNLVDKSWLRQHAQKPVWRDIPPRSVNGVNSKISIVQIVTFDFYIHGTAQGTDAYAHFTITADVIAQLAPKLLLGTNFLHSYGGRIDFVQKTVRFAAALGLQAKGKIFSTAKTLAHRIRVQLAETIAIPPGQTVIAKARWPHLPPVALQGQAYHFLAETSSVVDSTVDQDTAQVVVVHNRADRTKHLPEGLTVGRIIPYEREHKAFLLDDIDDYPGDIPDIDGGVPNYGLNKPLDVPCIKSSHGVSIAAEDAKDAAKLKEVIEEFDIYHDRGIIPMQEEEKMKIPFAEGWQTQRRTVRQYPLGRRDQQIIDDMFDDLRAKGKFFPMLEPTPVARPAFVAWRTVDGVRKPRPVIDLRPINSSVVPDVYPLPDQTNIMTDTRGKRYKSVLDAAGFFYQLPIYGPHRNRMAVITHRGLEGSNVVLMGFRNSPPYAQRWMDRLFWNYRHFVRVYIDDIVIFSDTLEEHIVHLCIVLKLLLDNRVHIAAHKSFVGYEVVRLLGYLVDANGIRKTPDRIEAFRKIQMPTNLAELETYLGMA